MRSTHGRGGAVGRVAPSRVVPSVVGVVLLALAPAACSSAGGGFDGQAAGDTRVQAVATFSVLGEVVAAVGGERVTTETIVPVGGDPHSYEPRPSDVAAISEADLVVDNSLGLSPWMSPLASNVEGTLLEVGQRVDTQLAQDDTGRTDPHIWLDPQLLADVGDVIADELARIDPAGTDAYRRRAEQLRADLDALDAEIAEMLSAIPDEQRLLASYEYAYSYFARAYDLEIVGSVIGATTEEEPSAAQVRRLIDLVDERGVPAVFPQQGEPTNVIGRVARDSSAALGTPLYVDSVGEPGTDADSYAGMMRANAEAVLEGLTGGEAGS